MITRLPKQILINLELLSQSSYKGLNTVTFWTEGSKPGPLAKHQRGTQGLETTLNWPMITREYDPTSAIGGPSGPR